VLQQSVKDSLETVADPGLANGGARSSAAKKILGGGAMSPLQKNFLILNLKLLNSSHSERHFAV